MKAKSIMDMKLKEKGKPRDQTSRRIKKALGGQPGGVLARLSPKAIEGNGWKDKMQASRPIAQQENPDHGARSFSVESSETAIAEWLAGATQAEVEAKYGMSAGYIAKAVQRRFLKTESGRKMLESLVLENAIASSVHFSEKLPELSGVQAAMTAGIFTDKFIALQRLQGNAVGATPNFAELAEVGNTLEYIKRVAGEIVGG
jgi:hypothetical protein